LKGTEDPNVSAKENDEANEMTIRRFVSTLFTLTAICVCVAGLPGILFAQDVKKYNTPAENCKANYDRDKKLVEASYKKDKAYAMSQTGRGRELSLQRAEDAHLKAKNYIWRIYQNCLQNPGNKFKNRSFERGSSLIRRNQQKNPRLSNWGRGVKMPSHRTRSPPM
jgi:hypothetical protein